MENKTVGYILLGISAVICFITYSFNTALKDIVNSTCDHGPTCPMNATINFQTNLSIGIIIAVILFGLYLIFYTKKPRRSTPNLDKEEKFVYDEISKANGTIFQSELMEKTNLNKVKITRILDRLEGKGIAERKRRGMTNIVILK